MDEKLVSKKKALMTWFPLAVCSCLFFFLGIFITYKEIAKYESGNPFEAEMIWLPIVLFAFSFGPLYYMLISFPTIPSAL